MITEDGRGKLCCISTCIREHWAWCAMAVLTGIITWAGLTCCWIGPQGKDPFFYTDAAFLKQYYPNLALRYVHIYALAGAFACFKSMAVGGGVYALAVFLGLVWLSFAFGRRIGGGAAGVLSAVLVVVSPLAGGWYATNPTCDIPSLLYSGLALFLVLPPARGRVALRWVFAGVLAFLAFRTKETSAVVGVPLLWLVFRTQPVESWRKRLAGMVAGTVAASALLVVLDGVFLGHAWLSLNPATYMGQVTYNLRQGGDSMRGPYFVDLLCDRWTLPITMICALGVAHTMRRNRVVALLSLWAASSLVLQAFAMSASQFGAGSRYLMPVLVPLMPVAAGWIVGELAVPLAGRGKKWPFHALALAALVAVGGAVATLATLRGPHFPKKAFYQMFPAWAVVGGFVVSLLPLGDWWRKALVCAFVAYAVLVSAYVSGNHCKHAHRVALSWMAIGRAMRDAPDASVEIVGARTGFPARRMSTFSDGRARVVAHHERVPVEPTGRFLLVRQNKLTGSPPPGYRRLGAAWDWHVFRRVTAKEVQ